MSSTCEDEPTPKHLKTSNEGTDTGHWAHLPSLVLTIIFGMLNQKDKLNASIVCKHWSENIFQPRLWTSFTFVIDPHKLEKGKFLNDTFGLTVTNAKIVIKSVSTEYLKELIKLLQSFKRNKNLKDLIITYRPPVPINLNIFDDDEDRLNYLDEVERLLSKCLKRLTGFTADCMQALDLFMDTILKNLNPTLVRKLALSNMLCDCETYSVCPALIKCFTKLEELTLDEHAVTDELLDSVESSTAMKTLFINHHILRTIRLDSSGRALALLHSLPHETSQRFIRFMNEHPGGFKVQQEIQLDKLIITRYVILKQ